MMWQMREHAHSPCNTRTRVMESSHEMAKRAETTMWSEDEAWNRVHGRGNLEHEKQAIYALCKNHGGMSTGPKTADGIERISARSHEARNYSKQAKAERAGYWAILRACGKMLADLQA